MKYNKIKARKKTLALAISAVLSAACTGAFAEEAITNNSADENVEKISITGSRIDRTTFDAPTPTVVISAAEIKMSGLSNVNDLLTSMPQLGDGTDSASNSFSFGNSGLNILDLRDMGESRTLVLVNGKRPTGVANDSNGVFTDIGMIPTALLERIEIITGGASAVYGSDAVAGVVNFILKKNYDGTSLSGQVGNTHDGGHNTTNLTLTHGFNFDGNRGNLSFTVDYLKESVLRESHRKGSTAQQRSVTNPRNTGPDDGIPDKISLSGLTTTEWGATETIYGIWQGEHGTQDWYQINHETGEHSLRIPANEVYDGWLAQDGKGFALDRWNLLENPFERANAYVALNYQFDSFDLTADITYSKSKSSDEISAPFIAQWIDLSSTDLGYDVPEAVRTVANEADQGWARVNYTFFEAGPRANDIERDYLQANLSLSGLAFEDWGWDVNFSSGKSQVDLLTKNRERIDRIKNTSDGSPFNIIGSCLETNDCPAFSPFERPSQEVLDYVLTDFRSLTDVVTHAASANLAGDLFELPAGIVQMSAGLEVRHESLDYAPAEIWQSENLKSRKTPMDASRNIKEVYAEVLVPLLSDLPAAQALDLELAVRKAEYSTEGSSFNSAKLGLNWTINNALRFRSTYSSAVRAPQLEELFSGESVGFITMTDPCDVTNIGGGPADGRRAANCALLGIESGWTSNLTNGRGNSVSTGNEALKEEKATTFTLGFVAQPTFVDNFRFSLDYWSIELEDMIVDFGENAMLSNCVDLAPNSIDNDFCRNVTRQSGGNVTEVRPGTVNADESRRRGVDIEADYSLNNFTFKLAATRLYESSLTQFDFVEGLSLKDDDVGQLGIPKWKANFTTTFTEGDFSASWTFKFREAGRLNVDDSEEFRDSDTPGNSIIHNVRAAYDFSDEANVYVGINNLTDHSGVDHQVTSYGKYNGWGVLGRNYYAGFVYKF